MGRHIGAWPPTESVLAEEFVSSFNLVPSTPNGLQQLCVQLGISLSFSSLPAELRGFNCAYQDRMEIVLSEQQGFWGAQEHTLLHELREILERSFITLGYPTVGHVRELEGKAEDFARFTRMAAISKSLPTFFELAEQIERKWVQVAALVLIGCGALFYFYTCAMLPRFEGTAEW
jgi:hypothetical protein